MPDGTVAVMSVPREFTLTFVASVFPISTVGLVPNPPPEIVIDVPTGPEVGLTEVTDGEYVKFAFDVVREVPPLVVTLTGTVPVPGGEIAVIVLSLFTVNCAVAVPKSTFSAFVKPDPEMVTVVPPLAGPDVGVIPDIVPADIPLNASPLVSTDAQKLVEEHDTEVRLALLSVGIVVVLQLPPPLHSRA